MRKKKMTKKEMNMAMLAEALRSLNEIVAEEEPEDWGEESKDEKLSEEEDDRCAYCDKEIDQDSEVFGVLLTIGEVYDLKDLGGEMISVCLEEANRSIPAMVATEDSDAKKDGGDICFMTCSERCAQSLTTTLQKEIDFWKITLKQRHPKTEKQACIVTDSGHIGAPGTVC
jgi:hypothetical protein